MPSFFNGIFGHKPSRGIVSNYEQQPVAESVLQNFLTTGPMSRFSCDLLPMYRVMASENISQLKLDTKVLTALQFNLSVPNNFLAFSRYLFRNCVIFSWPALVKPLFWVASTLTWETLKWKLYATSNKLTTFQSKKYSRHFYPSYQWLPNALSKVHFPKFYHAMEIWSVKMSTGDNPPFAEELAMRQVRNNL